jgi:hypothetical protein
MQAIEPRPSELSDERLEQLSALIEHAASTAKEQS